MMVFTNMGRKPRLTQMKPDWARALEVRRVDLELSQELTAEAGEMSQTYYSEIERGEKTLDSLTLTKLKGLAKALRWTIQELEQATGVDLGYASWDAFEQNMLKQGRLSESSNVTPISLVQVPVLSLMAALTGDWDNTTPVSYIEILPEIARQPHRVTFLMDSDSMNPTMNAGDSIHVNTSETGVEDGRVYLVVVQDAAPMVKRARAYAGGALWLISDSADSDQPPMPAESVRVVGRVFGVSPQMRRL